MRWNDSVTLIRHRESWQDERGTWHEGGQDETNEVFCNVGVIGTMTMAQLRSSDVRITNGKEVPETGLSHMHLLYVRTVDYSGEEQVRYHGEEMQVVTAVTDGENTKLLVRKRFGNE